MGSNRIYSLSIQKVMPKILYIFCIFLLAYFYKASTRMVILTYLISGTLVSSIIFFLLKPSFRKIKENSYILLKEIRKFGLNLYVAFLFGTSSGYIAGLPIPYFLNNEIFGFFSLAKVISQPLSFLPNSIGIVLFKKFYKSKQIRLKIIFATFFLSLVSLAFFFILINKIFFVIYPINYSDALKLTKIISFSNLIRGFADFYSSFLKAQGKGKYIRDLSITVGILSILGNIILVRFFKLDGAIITIYIVNVYYLFIVLFFYYKTIKANGK